MTDVPTAEDEGFEQLAGLERDMKVLAESEPAAILEMLAPLPEAYAAWIERKRASIADPGARLAGFEEPAERALERCERALARIREGLEVLRDDAQAMAAFRFANRAMWLQRIHSILAEQRRHGEEVMLDDIDLEQNRSWHPFQLAFILLNLRPATELDHPDRSDPTAPSPICSGFRPAAARPKPTWGSRPSRWPPPPAGRRRRADRRVRRGGAHALHAAPADAAAVPARDRADLRLRADPPRGDRCGDRRWGEEPFRIGLWVGQRATPNTVAEPPRRSDAIMATGRGPGGGIGTPPQLTNCPWCGSAIDPRQAHQGRAVPGRPRAGDHLLRRQARPLRLLERRSPGEGLGVVVVDEEIYRRLPALLIATVDKFAQMPWKGRRRCCSGR